MSEGVMQSVLRCDRCNKPFDKQSTLKRHGYYCRSRNADNGTRARTRACVSCVKVKKRCNHRQPGCSRCTTKGLECHYPAETATEVDRSMSLKKIGDGSTNQQKLTTSLPLDTPVVQYSFQSSNDDGILLANTLATSDAGLANLGVDNSLYWDVPDINLDLAEVWDSQISPETVRFPSPTSSSLVRQTTSSNGHRYQEQQQTLSSPKASIPMQPTSKGCSIIRRTKLNPGEQRIAGLILHNLKSYPLMMLRRNTLPPFIHPRLVSPNAKYIDDMEPLTNCISLVHMVDSGLRGSRKLFWKNVHLECERFLEDHLKLNERELLAAMQALCLYILMRLDGAETEDNHFDFRLVAAVAAIAKQLQLYDLMRNEQDMEDDDDLEETWNNWIFEESRRRIAVLYRVVNMLVYFEPGSLCKMQRDLVLAPLPAKKQLWEAADEFTWKAESEREPGFQTAFALAADGDLVKLDNGQLFCGNTALRYSPLHPRTTSNSNGEWEEWCAGMDGFGGLIMLTASLAGH